MQPVRIESRQTRVLVGFTYGRIDAGLAESYLWNGGSSQPLNQGLQ